VSRSVVSVAAPLAAQALHHSRQWDRHRLLRTRGAPGAPPLGYPVVAPMGSLASWGTRAIGSLIDIGTVFGGFIVVFILSLVVHPLIILAYILAIGAGLFLAYQVGETGQSPGMRVAGVRCVHIGTGQPIGPGLGILRGIAHAVDSFICYVGWLFPLWDSKRQTLADKIMSTVVVTVPKQGFSFTPQR
jgi:uncharacterized RDD family membrane protein YckC